MATKIDNLAQEIMEGLSQSRNWNLYYWEGGRKI